MSEIYVQLKYVLFSWRTSSILKKDPLAKAFFAEHMTMNGLFRILGSPIAMIEASIGTKPRELFLTNEQCDVLRAKLAESMGPTRSNSSWRPEANIRQTKLLKMKTASFAKPQDVEKRMAELQKVEESAATNSARSQLQQVRRVWQIVNEEQRGSFIALDVETWEQDHNVLTEFGWSTLTFGPDGEQRDDVHTIIEENTSRRNGRWCADARDHYDFGESEYIPQEDLRERLSKLFDKLSASAPLFIVMHDPRSDLDSLELLGIDTRPFLRSVAPLLQPGAPLRGTYVLDTQALYCGWKGEKRKSKLESCCEAMNVDTQRLHNAGNDAHYTLAVLEGLMETEMGAGPANLKD